MPDKAGAYIVATRDHMVTAARYYADDYRNYNPSLSRNITHWMPFPPHPEEMEPRINDSGHGVYGRGLRV